MSSASEEVQILVENSDSVSTDQEDTELHEDGRSNDKVRKANIKTKEVPSSIDESELLNVSYMYNIPSEYNLVHPSKYMRADEALDSESLMLYAEDFRSRVRLPLSESLISFCNEYHLTISQMHPNSLRIMCELTKLACQDGTQLTTRAIHALYMLQDRGREDFYFLQARTNYNVLHKRGMISSSKRWKHKFFIVKHKGGFGKS
ncbi:hypothetical protein JCGZ_06653 [Jatropha curcas]|uniref:Uncharacterized protein n=1 Tax=Jatropha curcas TaxID=180498 RepID=A0A067LCK7_JATCU|nr:hypothetical protein JCGZ_06653 [Jatropha curcas]